VLQQYAIVAADLNKPLRQTQTKQRRGIAVPILAASLSGSLFGSAILWAVLSDNQLRSERAPGVTREGQDIVPAAKLMRAEATPAVAAAVEAMTTAKTVTVTIIDSQTGAKREVVLPASASAQSEDNQSKDNSVPRSTTPLAAAQTGQVLTPQHELRRAHRKVQQLMPRRSGGGPRSAQAGAGSTGSMAQPAQ
jgi:hypothetical protein